MSDMRAAEIPTPEAISAHLIAAPADALPFPPTCRSLAAPIYPGPFRLASVSLALRGMGAVEDGYKGKLGLGPKAGAGGASGAAALMMTQRRPIAAGQNSTKNLLAKAGKGSKTSLKDAAVTVLSASGKNLATSGPTAGSSSTSDVDVTLRRDHDEEGAIEGLAPERNRSAAARAGAIAAGAVAAVVTTTAAAAAAATAV